MTRSGAILTGTRCFIALGSNVGAREEQVLAAMARIERCGAGSVIAASALYETDPVGMPGARAFINAVVEVETPLTPDELLSRLQGVERDMGRLGGHYQPRNIDIDIISYGEQVIDEPDLTVPHARYDRRAFVLVPLSDIAPAFVCPASARSARDMLDEVGANGVTRVSARATLGRRDG